MHSHRSPPPLLILASASPRRRELLSALGLPFDVVTPTFVEDAAPKGGETPEGFAGRLALAKATAVSGERPEALVLAADTIVVLDGQVLGKPGDAAVAEEMLRRLRGRSHRVITAVALIVRRGGRPAVARTESKVHFRRYSNAEIKAYVGSGGPMDKAGAYGVQDDPFHPAAEVRGCLLSVVGLPLCQVADLLREAGLPVSPGAGLSIPEPCLRRWGGCALAGGKLT